VSILIDGTSRVVVLGMTGGEGTFHTRRMLEYGTKVVAGMTPGKGGTTHLGLPVFGAVDAAVAAEGADVAVLFVPPYAAAEAVMEAAEAGLRLIVCVTEGIPTLDMLKVKGFLRDRPSLLIGPNTPGVISPGKSKVGIMPGPIHRPGPVGIISRSGTLTYEAVQQVTRHGYGQSTAVGIGGDPVVGLKFAELLALFKDDPETEAVVLIGEIGGRAEEEAAACLAAGFPKPVVGYVAGLAAPPGRRMGHAGAIVAGAGTTAREKIAALEAAGVRMAASPADIGAAVAAALGGRR